MLKVLLLLLQRLRKHLDGFRKIRMNERMRVLLSSGLTGEVPRCDGRRRGIRSDNMKRKEIAILFPQFCLLLHRLQSLLFRKDLILQLFRAHTQCRNYILRHFNLLLLFLQLLFHLYLLLIRLFFLLLHLGFIIPHLFL